FAALTVFAALSFYGVLKERRWRAAAIAPMLVTLALIGRYYWPVWGQVEHLLVVALPDAFPGRAAIVGPPLVGIEFDAVGPVRSRGDRRASGQDLARRGRRPERARGARRAAGTHQSAQ